MPITHHWCGAAEVWQTGAGSVNWDELHVSRGVEYDPPAWYWDSYFMDGSGALVWTGSGLWCGRVNTEVYWLFPPLQTNGSSSTWEQWSGAGDASCYGSYVAKDWLVIVGY